MGIGGEAITESDDIPQYYANVMSANGSPYDLTIDFGFKVGDGEPRWDARVSMSWEHALSMTVLLQRLIADFETKVGSVPNVEEAGLSTIRDTAEPQGESES